jgi:hypothetical protein
MLIPTSLIGRTIPPLTATSQLFASCARGCRLIAVSSPRDARRGARDWACAAAAARSPVTAVSAGRTRSGAHHALPSEGRVEVARVSDEQHSPALGHVALSLPVVHLPGARGRGIQRRARERARRPRGERTAVTRGSECGRSVTERRARREERRRGVSERRPAARALSTPAR